MNHEEGKKEEKKEEKKEGRKGRKEGRRKKEEIIVNTEIFCYI